MKHILAACMEACMADLACLAVGPDRKCGLSTISIKMWMLELNMIKQKDGVMEAMVWFRNRVKYRRRKI